MGHRALIIVEQKHERGMYKIRSSHWGALEAAHLGDSYHDMKLTGKPRKGVYDTLKAAVLDRVDFLFHEAVYLARPHRETRAFDTLWWRGAREYVPSPGGCIGVGALVELTDNAECGNFAHWSGDEDTVQMWDRSKDMEAAEFHEYLTEEAPFADRIPDWSPLGGSEIRVDDRYRSPVEA